MAAVIGALRVDLGLNSAEFEQGMKKATGALAGISKAFAALGGVALFAGFTAGIGAAVGRIEEMRKLTAQLDKALENTGNTANTSASEVEKFADRLERATGRAAEEVVAVSTNLATFGFSREVFYDAIELANDMSAAWGGDLKQNAEGLARALADPEKGLAMLTKRGITFTDQQKAMIASFMQANNLIGAQGVVMDALNEQVKGVAEAGFGGLTKAQANATLALEGFFETVANSLGVNAGLEMGLVAVAAALDFVTNNIDVLAKGATVAGAAIAVALGPSVWAAVSAAAVAMSTAVVGAIRAIGVAIAANPIGLLITALAAAVTAAFVFRDEIKQAIGIDFVGIVKDAVNLVIGAFVGAFDGIVAVWGQIPSALGDLVYQGAQSAINGVIYLVRTVQVTLNGFLADIDKALVSIGAKATGFNVGIADYVSIDNPYAGAAGDAAAAFGEAFSAAQQDYLGQLGEKLGFVGEQATAATTQIAGLGAALDGAGTEGGAAGGAKRLGAASDDTKTKLQDMGNVGQSVASTLSSGFKDIFKSLITGSGNAMDAVSGLLNKLGDLFLDQAFNLLLGGIGGGGGGLGGIFSGIGKLFGFARGGTIMPGGSGGIDSQLVAFRKSPNERVDITKPGQTLTSGFGGTIQITTDDARFRASMRDEAGQVVAETAPAIVGTAVGQSNKAAPSAIARYQSQVAGGDYRVG